MTPPDDEPLIPRLDLALAGCLFVMLIVLIVST